MHQGVVVINGSDAFGVISAAWRIPLACSLADHLHTIIPADATNTECTDCESKTDAREAMHREQNNLRACDETITKSDDLPLELGF